jgi:hypothetical protein
MISSINIKEEITMEKCKCLCCGNEMTRYLVEDYEKMSSEERDNVINEHLDQCEWVKQFKIYFEEDVTDWTNIDIIQSLRVESVIDILVEKGIADKADIKNRMIKKAGRAIDLEARDKIIKLIKEKVYIE